MRHKVFSGGERGALMSRHVSRHKRQRRMVVGAAATASVLMAVSAPVAAASPGHTPTPPTHPGGTSTANSKPVASISHRQTTVSHITPTPKVTGGSDPGLNIGTEGTGNSNFGNQTNPLSVQLFHLGNNNTNVANNTGP